MNSGMFDDGWTTIQYKKRSDQKSKQLRTNSGHKSKYDQEIRSSLALTDMNQNIIMENQILGELERILGDAFTLSETNSSLRHKILPILEYYRQKLTCTVTGQTKNIWDTSTFSKNNNNQLDSPTNRNSIDSRPHLEPYQSVLSYPVQSVPTQNVKLSRARSTSWNCPSAPPGFPSPRRLFSPQCINHRTLDLNEITAKLDKAQEMRDLISTLKSKKMKEKTQNINERLNMKEEQRIQLKKSIDEKLSKAEKNRNNRLHKIQKRARKLEQKQKEVILASQQILDSKKVEVQQREEEVEARLRDIEEERMRKILEHATQMEAVNERKRIQDEQRLKKIESDKQKVEEKEKDRLKLQEKRQKDQEQKVTIAHERQERALQFQAKQQEIKRNKLDKKIQLGLLRKEEQIQQVKEKAATANQNAKMVANRIKHNTEQSIETPASEIETENTNVTVEIISDFNLDKSARKKIKKSKDKLQSLVKDYVFFPFAVKPLDIAAKQHLDTIRATLKTKAFGKIFDSFTATLKFLKDENQFEAICNELCASGILQDIVTTLSNDDMELAAVTSGFELLATVLKNNNVSLYILQSETLPVISLCECFCKLIPYCNFRNADSPYFESTIHLLDGICSALTDTNDATKTITGSIIKNVISYLCSTGLFNQLQAIFGLTYGSTESLAKIIPFLTKTIDLLDIVVGFGNEKHFENEKHLSLSLTASTELMMKKILETNMVGLITLLDTVLFSNGCGSYRIAGKELIQSGWKVMALRVLSLANKLCLIDHKKVQSWLDLPNQSTEVFHLMLFWMKYFSVRPNETDVTDIINNVISLIRHVCVDHPKLLQMVQIGFPEKTLLQRLATLPFSYFGTKEGRLILFPTLIVLCLEESNRMVLEDVVSVEFLKMFLELEEADKYLPDDIQSAFLASF
ncbi:hypothetical protein BC833DRAFT_610641 [Globomyces pollinis-pini]|nr:hypothetical protein BC833DRAFT_610641 [Globomyces pollinis-pini]